MRQSEELELLRSVKSLGINLSRIYKLYKNQCDERKALDWISNVNRNYEIKLEPDAPDFDKHTSDHTVWYIRQYIQQTKNLPINVHIDGICITRVLKMEYVFGEESTLKITLGIK